MTAAFNCDVVVVGAGVVGLAVARALALRGRDVTVLETERMIGSVTSSRNSEVIHSGIYYAPGSLKAKLCVEGRAGLYAFCASRGIPHRACGKLIVAADGRDREKLEALAENGRCNGVGDCALLDVAELRALEPAVAGCSALLCPMTGIVDSHTLMQALHADIEAAGGMVCLGTPALDGFCHPYLGLRTGGSEPALLKARLLINAAGLMAPDLARRLEDYPSARAPTPVFAKGNYFSLTGRAPFTRLIYPLPEPGGLGVHATLDLAGQIRFGPDVEWVQSPDDYQVDGARAKVFYEAIRRYWPDLPNDALRPAYSGIRPKLAGPGFEAGDFVIEDESTHDIPGLINLFGIESPGLTSCLALGSYVAERVEDLAA